MPKQVTKTTVKLSITHDRLACTVKYTNGTDLKFSSSRSAERISTSDLGKSAEIKKLFAFTSKNASNTETNGERFERLAKFFEGTTSLVDAASKIPA